MKNKKQLLFALGLTVILFLMIISASYLIFSISKLGKEKKTVKSGIMLMNYTGLNNTFSIIKHFQQWIKMVKIVKITLTLR